MNTTATSSDALQCWWSITRDALTQRGIPVVRGELAGARVPIIALDPDTAEEDVATVLDVLAPRLATWWTEDGDDGPAAHFVGLLSGEAWHVVECGVDGDLLDDEDDFDEDDGGGYFDRSPTPEIRETVERWAKEIADELVAQAGVEDPHGRDAIGSVLSERLAERIAHDAGDDQERYHRAVWSVQRDAADTALRALRLNHVRQIRTDAARYAADILAADPDLARAGKVARRDTVYHHMKTIDSQCVTRESIQPVTAALEKEILTGGAEGSLFG